MPIDDSSIPKGVIVHKEAQRVGKPGVERVVIRGLKDHEIADVVNTVTMRLHRKLPNMPQCLRELVRGAIVENLEAHGLRLDA